MNCEFETYRILIVEDEKGIAEAVQNRMARWDLKAETVTDFRKVMDDFARVRPHLVLMDISLPYMNGYHWCAEIRKVSPVPVIFVSSASDNMNIIMAVNMGADGFGDALLVLHDQDTIFVHVVSSQFIIHNA